MRRHALGFDALRRYLLDAVPAVALKDVCCVVRACISTLSFVCALLCSAL